MNLFTLSKKKKILITVKTYPTLSGKYDELVCTAGITEKGEWVRLYPISFRKLQYEQQYKKYQWIELDVIKNKSDPRRESYRPVDTNKIKIGDFVDTKNKWVQRRKIVLKNVYDDLDKLIADNKNDNGVSLAVFKPTKISNFIIEETEREWDQKKLKAIEARAKQMDLFGEKDGNPFQIAKKLPYKFSYIFEDSNGQERKVMIEDWELGQLFWNCLKSANGDENIACKKVKEKYLDEFSEKDLHFYMGTTRQFDSWAKNPFLIIGVFYPPKDNQLAFL